VEQAEFQFAVINLTVAVGAGLILAASVAVFTSEASLSSDSRASSPRWDSAVHRR
jgi:hypothetical protein